MYNGDMDGVVAFVDRNYRALIFLLIAVGMVFLGFLIFAIVSANLNSGAYVVFSFAPTDAVLKIDGEEYHIGSYEFSPGAYSGTLSSNDDFNNKEIKFEIKHGETINISEYLLHKSLGIEYFEKNKADLDVLRTVHGDNDVDAFLRRYDEKNSIMSSLPLNASFKKNDDIVRVIITDGRKHKDCDMTLCLLVSGRTIDKDVVVSVIGESGYDINDYKVIYEYD